ncbi:pentatricopeptide repeat-containing protein At1g31920 [Salvia splendens]|uniref:pentatricopeptide repeat-containing protein At1g31920 n=1 Tax=Salvia splendens TaxID=180675 RepID=UPI0011008D2D|nr:pentatricopeptide repeat-containing protein At1g31920 [Salvia splendens]
MVVAYVLNQPHEFITHNQTYPKIPETDHHSNQKEHECISLIKKCKNLDEFKQIHGHVFKLGLLWSSSFCASNLISTCALSQWGSMDYACSIFDQLDDPCSFDFNTIIRGHTMEMSSDQALLAYLDMLEIGVEPDSFTYPPLLKACASLSAAGEGMQIHGHVFKHGLVGDVFVHNSLINMYGKCGLLRDSCAVFDQMEVKTVASWSAVIAAHASLGMWGECLRLFFCMIRDGGWRPEESVLVSVLSACTHLGRLDLGRCIHGYLVRNLSGLNAAVETAVVDMYIRCGSLEKGMSLFQEMVGKNHKSFSVAISGLASHGRSVEALVVFEEMIKVGLRPDDVVYVSVLSACSHAGLVQEGVKYFERMRKEHRIEPTVQHYGCMVDLMGRAGLVDEAHELIKGMPMAPNDVVWRSLLSACKIHQNLELGEVAAERLMELNGKNAVDYLMLCSIYAQAGRWEDVSLGWVRMGRVGVGKEAGTSAVLVGGKLHRFVSNDALHHPLRGEIREMVHQMEWQLRFEGYEADTSQVVMNVGEEEKRERLRGHSQKLAIAFALVSTSKGSVVRIVRNVRMCSDCHTYTKMISVIYERHIIVRDGNVYHHFKHGTCSCRDYW